MAETKEVSYLGFNRTKTQIQNSSGLSREECLRMIGASAIEWWRSTTGHEFRVYIKSGTRYYWGEVKTSYSKLRAEGCVRIDRETVYKPSPISEEEYYG